MFLVAAIDHARGAVLGQCQVASKQGEGPAAQDLLTRLNVPGMVWTLDALHTMKTTTRPEVLRQWLRGLSDKQLLAACARLRPDTARLHDPIEATKHPLRTLAARHAQLTAEITALDVHLAALVQRINPALLELNGVGVDVAGQLLVTAGGNPDRIRTEPKFATLCGVAPLPASSGRTNRHRLNRGGDRQANAALYRVVLCRLRWDPRTRAYAERRTAEGLSKKEIIRCLKRLIAREIYYTLTPAPNKRAPLGGAPR